MYGLQDYQKERIETFLDPSQGSARRRLPADSGQGDRRVRRPVGQGLPARAPRVATASCPSPTTTSCIPCWPRSTGSWACWSRSALYLFVIVRSLDAAKLAKDRVGAFLVVAIISGFRVPGVVQHHDVGRVGPRKGSDAAAHELWRVVARRDARRVWPHPERQDEAVYELTYGSAVRLRALSAALG